MKSWLTSLGGILVAIGTPLAAANDPNIKLIGVVIGAIGALILGIGAKDFNVTGGTKPR